jgi:hypothetical protein
MVFSILYHLYKYANFPGLVNDSESYGFLYFEKNHHKSGVLFKYLSLDFWNYQYR